MFRRGNRLLAVSLLLASLIACGRDEAPAPGGDLELDVGLTPAEPDSLRFLTEGSDLFPVDLLFALESAVTGKPFVESMDRYGFLPSPKSEANPFGLPIARVGYVTDVAQPVFIFDVGVDGNSNAGHEFGTALSETERLDLVEYLKTL